MYKPPAPNPLLSKDKKWRLIPVVSIYKMERLQPRSEAEEVKARTDGFLHRILYTRDQYEHAIRQAEMLVESGVKAHRIEFVHAREDETVAIMRGDFLVVPAMLNDVADVG